MGALDQVTRQAGQGLDALLNSIVGGLDKSITAGLSGVAGALGSVGNAASSSISQSSSGLFSSLGSLLGSDSPAQAQAPVRQMEASIQPKSPNHVDMTALGSLSAPSFNSGVVGGQSFGRA